MTHTVNFGKVKIQNSVGLKYKFYKAILKVSSFWRGFICSTKLDSRYISCEVEEENSRRSTSFHHQYLVIYLKYILIYSDVHMIRYFLKSFDPILTMLLSPKEECHLDFSSKSCTYPSLVT